MTPIIILVFFILILSAAFYALYNDSDDKEKENKTYRRWRYKQGLPDFIDSHSFNKLSDSDKLCYHEVIPSKRSYSQNGSKKSRVDSYSSRSSESSGSGYYDSNPGFSFNPTYGNSHDHTPPSSSDDHSFKGYGGGDGGGAGATDSWSGSDTGSPDSGSSDCGGGDGGGGGGD